jgi:hypothetical protein
VYATAFGPARASLERRFDWLINGNFLCRPFLSVQTVARIVQHAQVAEKPFLTADAFCGIIWDETGRAVVGAGKTSNTVTNPIAYVANHLADGIPASILGLDEETAAAVPVALPIAEHDRIDIDTLADLHRARQVSLGRLETLAALVAESCPFEVEEIAALDSVPGLVKWLLGRMHRLQRRELER